MPTKRTIVDAAIEALRTLGAPACAEQLLDAIKERSLYDFHAKEPAGVLRAAIRKHVKAESTSKRRERAAACGSSPRTDMR